MNAPRYAILINGKPHTTHTHLHLCEYEAFTLANELELETEIQYIGSETFMLEWEDIEPGQILNSYKPLAWDAELTFTHF